MVGKGSSPALPRLGYLPIGASPYIVTPTIFGGNMQVGDLVKIKNLHPSWGEVGIVTRIVINKTNGLGQISLLSNGVCRAIPWWKRQDYLEVICK